MSFRLLFIFAVSVLIFAISGCVSTKSSGTPEPYAIYPPPPDTARFQFLTSISNSEKITGARSGFAAYILGEGEAFPINKPYGIASSKGLLAICDPAINGLEILDFEKSTFDYFIPSGKGQLKTPLNCAFDANQNLFVADVDRKQIVVFTKDLEYMTCFGDTGSFKPTDVCVKNDKIYVPNSIGNKVNVYSCSDFKLVSSFPNVAKGTDGYLYSPVNITLSNDKIYVADFGDFKVKIYDNNGNYISSVGSYGKSIGQFVRPKGISTDKDENLFVVDAGFENVQIFNKSNKLLMYFGGPYNVPGDMWLPAKVHIDYDNADYFKTFVDPEYDLNYLVFVSNQYGPDKINVYAAVKPSKNKAEKTKYKKKFIGVSK